MALGATLALNQRIPGHFGQAKAEWLADLDDRRLRWAPSTPSFVKARDQGESLDVVDTQLVDHLERLQ
jgi:hypothetical protein